MQRYSDAPQRRRITAASSHEIARYITEETIARMVMAVMTMLSLKIWLPYWMRYPRPVFADWNSPTTTPTRDNPTFTLSAAISVGMLPGSTTLLRSWPLVAPNVCASLILLGSMPWKPL